MSASGSEVVGRLAAFVRAQAQARGQSVEVVWFALVIGVLSDKQAWACDGCASPAAHFAGLVAVLDEVRRGGGDVLDMTRGPEGVWI